MITPAQAESLIRARTLTLGEENIPLHMAMNRVLAEDLHADTDLPPFHRVMMDGIALNYRAIENGARSFPIQAMQRAGDAPITLTNDTHCIEIMTGGVCSIGCDTVVPYEHIRIENGVAYIEIIPTEAGKNIHSKGSDKRCGDVLATAGARIGPAEIGIAASIGKSSLKVKRLPRVLVCSTGDELVEIQQTPLAHQIRRSNVYALKAVVHSLGIQAEDLHLPDNAEQLQKALKNALQSFDVLLLSGGVSKGKFDLLPEVLSELGVNSIFHGIAQRPGKPMWFGSSENCVVFALPGNPVSTMACAYRYVLPWFRQQMSLRDKTVSIKLNAQPVSHDKLTLLLPVKLQHDKSEKMGVVLKHQGSGDFSALVGLDGFVEVGPGESTSSDYLFYNL
jgi:molybdopterin molybdotransferase